MTESPLEIPAELGLLSERERVRHLLHARASCQHLSSRLQAFLAQPCAWTTPHALRKQATQVSLRDVQARRDPIRAIAAL